MRDCIHCIRLSALILQAVHDLSLPGACIGLHGHHTIAIHRVFAAFMRFNVSLLHPNIRLPEKMMRDPLRFINQRTRDY